MKSTTIATKLEELAGKREALRAKLEELRAQRESAFDLGSQAKLRTEDAELQGELNDIEATIAAGKKAYEETLAAEAQKNAEKWQSELYPKAMAEREQALSAVLDKLTELRAAYDQLKATEARWEQVRAELGSPPPAPRPLARGPLANFLLVPAVPTPQDYAQEHQKAIRRLMS